MKKRMISLWLLAVFVCLLVLPGCSENFAVKDNNPMISDEEYKPVDPTENSAVKDNGPTVYEEEYKPVEQVGQIPNALKNVIENNLFRDITAFDGRLLKAEILSVDEANKSVTQKVRMMDVYGNDLAEYICSSDDAYHITTLTATADGGFLFVLSFSDYAYDGKWASEKGFASHVIKCDNAGKLQFDTPFDGVGGLALEYCFERNGQFFFFGTIQTPETKTQGIYSRTDIYMVILDKNGAVLNTQYIAGSDFDSLDAAEMSGDGFVLSISSQSDDGDFAGSDSNGYPTDWVITVNDNLEITEKKKESGRDYFDSRIGEKDGVSVHKSNALLNDFDAGSPQAFIDYSDFYLIVSENNTGIYENTPPMISSIWYYTETVYSAYNYNGELLFRTSVDSSPDFDAWVFGMQP